MRKMLIIITAVVIATYALAGPTTPPAGPVASTYKTLDEVEPRTLISAATTISAPGSYYLANDINATGIGVTINSGGVTLDLNGFTIRGDGSGTIAERGIDINAGSLDAPIVIRNGFIENFTGAGIEVASSSMEVIVRDVHVIDCNYGMLLRGSSQVSDSTARQNTLTGFYSFEHTTFTNCTAEANGDNGFEAERGVFRDCVSSNNTNHGFGLGTDTGGTNTDAMAALYNCVANDNSGNGFRAEDAVVFSNCIAKSNNLVGFHALAAGTIVGCLADTNLGGGFVTGPGSTVSNTTSSNNTGHGFDTADHATFMSSTAHNNTGNGFLCGGYTMIESCNAYSNGTDGFSMGTASNVQNSTASFNSAEGFDIGSDSRISNCTADSNTTAGISGGSDTTIDSNTVTDNGVGILLNNGSLATRNTAANNTAPWDVSGTTWFFEFVFAPSAPNSWSTVSPWVNLSY